MTILQTSSVAASTAFGSGACTVTAASLSSTDVQAALNAAVAGDIVCLPAGTANWSTQVSRTLPANVTVRGAGWNSGTTGGGDATVIIDDYASGNEFLQLTPNSSGKFRLSGITVQKGTGSTKFNGTVTINGDNKLTRIDHCHGQMTTGSADNSCHFRINGTVTGVMDNCLFDLSGVGQAFQVEYGSYGGSSFGDGSWAAATGLGTSDFFFVEDSTFNGNSGGFSYICDSTNGGKFVARYNTINYSQLQTHPTGGANRLRGCRAWEIYGNTMTGDIDFTYNVFFCSSGTGVAWNNNVGNGYQNFFTLHSMRRDNTTYAQTATPGGWGYAGTSFNGTGSGWDQNSDATTGYQQLDKPGTGQGDLLSLDFPNTQNNALGGIAWPRQALEPIYEWQNTFTPATGYGGSLYKINDTGSFTANVDYYQYTASFNGSSGVGVGTLAGRPSSGLTVGVGYWATDTQTLYVATGSTTWTTKYQPYTYPHPMRA